MKTPELSPENCELLSALADGELQQQEWPALLQACVHDPAASGHWNSYHLIGEALRCPGGAVQLIDASFLTRLNLQLAKQPHAGPELQTTMPMPYSGVVCASASTMTAHMAEGGKYFQRKYAETLKSPITWDLLA